jgi:general secretion pathway protein D
MWWPRVWIFFGVAWLALGASGPDIAKRLAERARIARDEGEVVRAYLLYNEAARRDPAEPSYPASRDALAPAANLLMKTQLEDPVVAADIAAVEKEAEAAVHPPPPGTLELERSLESFPHVQPKDIKRDFDLKGGEISLIQQVVSAYGVRAAWDPQLDPKSGLRLELSKADFRSALEALTLVTNTFVFPISTNTLFFARDSEAKRSELEPLILLTVPLPDSMNEKDLIEVATAVRSVLNLRAFGWDSVSRTVFIKDRVTRALSARSLLEALLLPKAQVALEVQVLTLDTDSNYQYGISPPTSVSLFNLGKLNAGSISSLASTVATFGSLFAFGEGLGLFGIGVGQASLLASYTKSDARASYDAVLVTDDGQPASLHFGEKYPIPQSLYTGYAQSAASIYTPVPQFTEEDLGLALKMTPKVEADGSIAMDVDAEYKALGAVYFGTVPSVAQRKYTGSVVLREGEWAVIAGLDQKAVTSSRSGLAGLAEIPGLQHLLSATTHDNATSQTLILIKPQVTRLPVSANISPQYLVGPVRGIKVML